MYSCTSYGCYLPLTSMLVQLIVCVFEYAALRDCEVCYLYVLKKMCSPLSPAHKEVRCETNRNNYPVSGLNTQFTYVDSHGTRIVQIFVQSTVLDLRN